MILGKVPIGGRRSCSVYRDVESSMHGVSCDVVSELCFVGCCKKSDWANNQNTKLHGSKPMNSCTQCSCFASAVHAGNEVNG